MAGYFQPAMIFLIFIAIKPIDTSRPDFYRYLIPSFAQSLKKTT
jgi:hypothetical protein